jgi:hypothetical protein
VRAAVGDILPLAVAPDMCDTAAVVFILHL